MSILRWSKLFGALPLVVALAGLSGCENSPTTDAGDESTAEEAAPLAEAPAHPKGDRMRPKRGDHHRMGHGPTMLLGAALHELTLTEAQKQAIQAEMDSLHSDMEGHREDHKEARAALAAAVRTGKIDKSALVAQLAPKAPDTSRLAKAIGVLHDTLSAAQRKELVEKINSRMDRFAGPPHAEDDDAAPAKEPRREGRRGEGKERMHGRHGERGPLGHMLKDLSLSDAQREQIRGIMEKNAPSESDREAMKAKHEAFRSTMKTRLESFVSESFDAAAFVAPPEDGPAFGPDKMFGKMLDALAAVVPILDETQRAQLADNLEKGPRHPGMDKPWKDRAKHGARGGTQE